MLNDAILHCLLHICMENIWQNSEYVCLLITLSDGVWLSVHIQTGGDVQRYDRVQHNHGGVQDLLKSVQCKYNVWSGQGLSISLTTAHIKKRLM